MITLKEAYEIAKRHNPGVNGYSEYNDSFIFCHGDAENWIVVNKNTGQITDICRVGLLMDHLDDTSFCNALNNAVMSVKPIPQM